MKWAYSVCVCVTTSCSPEYEYKKTATQFSSIQFILKKFLCNKVKLIYKYLTREMVFYSTLYYHESGNAILVTQN